MYPEHDPGDEDDGTAKANTMIVPGLLEILMKWRDALDKAGFVGAKLDASPWRELILQELEICKEIQIISDSSK